MSDQTTDFSRVFETLDEDERDKLISLYQLTNPETGKGTAYFFADDNNGVERNILSLEGFRMRINWQAALDYHWTYFSPVVWEEKEKLSAKAIGVEPLNWETACLEKEPIDNSRHLNYFLKKACLYGLVEKKLLSIQYADRFEHSDPSLFAEQDLSFEPLFDALEELGDEGRYPFDDYDPYYGNIGYKIEFTLNVTFKFQEDERRVEAERKRLEKVFLFREKLAKEGV